jgi:hypothetical protein
MPVATATFSESTADDVGTRTRTSARSSAASLSPGPSAPASRIQREGTSRSTSSSGCASARGVNARTRKPSPFRDSRWPALQPHERHRERRAHRRPDGLAVQRIAGGGVEEHAVDAERRRDAEDAADVVRIADTLKGHETIAGRGRRINEIPARKREAAAVEVEAGHRGQDRRVRDVHRNVTGKDVLQRRERRGSDEHRFHLESIRL